MLTSTILSICILNLAATITIAWRILELQEELKRRSSINHDVTQQVPIRARGRRRQQAQSFNDVTTQNIRLPRSIRK